MNRTTTQLADMMLDMGTFEFRPTDPVRWASGYLMPVYNDNRRLLSDPAARALVARGFADAIGSRAVRIDGVVGTATAGIAPATSLADLLGTRLYYVRSGAKGHGLKRRVEGADREVVTQCVVLIDDVVSTGGSCAESAVAVHDAGFSIACGLSVFSYGFPEAIARFAGLPFPFDMISLITVDDLLGRATARGEMGPRELSSVREWLSAPFLWGEGRECSA